MLQMPIILVRSSGSIGLRLQRLCLTIAICFNVLFGPLFEFGPYGIKQLIQLVMAKRRQVEEELMESMDPKVQEARLLLNRKTVKYKPIPRFRSGCKNC